ncbi:MAG: acyl-ACP desaturase [Chloroflexota bacterium]
MSRTDGEYYLPPTAAPKLEALVDQIVARRGVLPDLNEMRAASDQIDVRKVVDTLPEGMTREDLVGILKLAMLTECATDSYAAVFQDGAERYNAPWLARFNEKVWVPDEHTHATPYQLMLQTLGYTEEELEREQRETQEKTYEHCCGRTPVELATYGVIQEYLTDNWHGLIANLLKPGAPYAAHCANVIKRRETLHTVWYRDMAALQVEENPELLPLVAKTVLGFQMPGTRLVPQFGTRALEWMHEMHQDFGQIGRDLVRNFADMAGTVKRTGQLLMDIAVRRGYPIGPFSPRLVQSTLNALGGPGYGLMGEAILDKVGLLPMSANRGGVYGKVRGRMRAFVADRIDLRVVTGETTAAPAAA